MQGALDPWEHLPSAACVGSQRFHTQGQAGAVSQGSQLGHGGVQLALRACQQRDMRSSLDKLLCQRQANARGSPGDQDVLAAV